MLKNKKAFTLVEMLIVIVIIGLLATALIPKLMGSREQANDATRLADLNQLGTAIAIYSADNGYVPALSGNADTVLSGMVSDGYIKSIAKDPLSTQIATFCTSNASNAGSYWYSPIATASAGSTANNFAITADTQVLKKGNRGDGTVTCPTSLSSILTEIASKKGTSNALQYVYAN